MKPLVSFCLLASAFCLPAVAQQYSLNWHKIGGGGGISTGGNYQLNATIGQTDASGVQFGGSYALTGGFWSFLAVPQIHVAPNGLVWTNTAGGNWNVAANWSPNRVPGAADTALITTPGSYGVSVTDNESVSNLVLGAASGTLTVKIQSGTFTVNGTGSDNAQSALVISGGTVNGPGSIVVGGPLTWSAGAIYSTVLFNGGTLSGGLNLYGGTLVNSGAFGWNGTVYFYPGSQFTNLVSGTLTFPAGAQANSAGGNNLDNEGQFNVVGPGTASATIPFINHGAVTVSNVTLQLSGGGTETGLFTNAVGGTLNLGSGTTTFTVNSSIVGAGNFTVSGGTANLGGSMNVAGTYTVSGGTANVTGACNPVSFTMSGGTLTGSQPVQVMGSGGFNWTAGAIYNTVQFNGGTLSGGLNLYGGTLVNSGAFGWNGTVYFYPGSQFTNLVSGTLTFPAGAQANSAGGNNLDNEGQFNVVGPGTASVTIPFINHGAVTVSNVTLQLSGGGTETGLFTNAVGGTLNLGSGTTTFTVNSSIVGAGNFTVSGGTANLGGSMNVAGTYTVSGGTANVTGACNPVSFTMSGGTLTGSQPVQVMGSGGFNWTAGAIYNTVQFNGGTLSGGLNLYGGTLVNSGAFGWNGTVYFYPGSQFTNLVSGTLTFPAGAQANSAGGNNLDNEGQFNVVGPGTASVTIPFINHGAVTVSNVTLQLSGGESLANGTLIFGITSSSSYGKLAISGPAALTGTLGVTFNGYSPALNDAFGLIAYGSQSGAFTAFNLPATVNWQKTYGATLFTLTVSSLVSGQPNLNITQSGGTVTVYWRNVSGWSLQQNNNLALPANWSASGGVTTSNGTNYLNITAPLGNLFFRLTGP